MSASQLPFEPPTPKSVSWLEILVGMVMFVGLALVEVLTGGLLTLLKAILVPALRDEQVDTLEAPTGPWVGPERDARGNVRCTRCTAFVPYASMALDEHGYFCARCRAAIIAEAVNPPAAG